MLNGKQPRFSTSKCIYRSQGALPLIWKKSCIKPFVAPQGALQNQPYPPWAWSFQIKNVENEIKQTSETCSCASGLRSEATAVVTPLDLCPTVRDQHVLKARGIINECKKHIIQKREALQWIFTSGFIHMCFEVGFKVGHWLSVSSGSLALSANTFTFSFSLFHCFTVLDSKLAQGSEAEQRWTMSY